MQEYSPAYKYRQLTKNEMNNCAKLILCYINFSFHCKFFKLIGGAYCIFVYYTFLNCSALFVQNRLAFFYNKNEVMLIWLVVCQGLLDLKKKDCIIKILLKKILFLERLKLLSQTCTIHLGFEIISFLLLKLISIILLCTLRITE